MSARVKLHPSTIKYLKKGHPWVTKDKFSIKFPRNYFFLTGNEGPHKDFCTLLNDPTHPQVKARLWSYNPVTTQNFFEKELKQRIDEALQKRIDKGIHNERDNFYIAFGEADQLPGLMIQKLGRCIFLQYYANYWEKYERQVVRFLLESLENHFDERFFIWRQGRNNDQQKNLKQITRNCESEFIIEEFKLQYKIKIDENYDPGIYSDMSAVRSSIEPLIKPDMNILNLYSYTGAFSLFALNKEAKVTSVDLSKKYLTWLEENILLNQNLKADDHKSICAPTTKALTRLKTEQTSFDLIICDPPSYSSDGKKRTSSYDSYLTSLAKMNDVLAKNGKLIIFINTHKISRQKFRTHIEQIITDGNLPLKIEKSYKLGADCPTVKGYHEGDYLKGLLLSKK